jgi:sn1-specific diacylglycerol lipase
VLFHIEYTKQFIISIVLGKDVVPRLGLHQMETTLNSIESMLLNKVKTKMQNNRHNNNAAILCSCPKNFLTFNKTF